MTNHRHSRQSFLGPHAQEAISRCTVAVVGLGGGGSHIVQQLAHIGFQRYVLYDADAAEDSNLNRLVGATTVDALAATPKIHIAKTTIYSLQSQATVRAFPCKWQEQPEPLRECQIVFGCVDSYKGRQELEVICRRYLMHYIDIGMDVHDAAKPVIGGQVTLSSPGNPCLECIGFLTQEKLGQEADRYGDAGERPQVVWPNGVLASTAVGIAVDLVTGWTRRLRPFAYLVYDGKAETLSESLTVRGIKAGCDHFPPTEIGDPVLTEL